MNIEGESGELKKNIVPLPNKTELTYEESTINHRICVGAGGIRICPHNLQLAINSFVLMIEVMFTMELSM